MAKVRNNTSQSEFWLFMAFLVTIERKMTVTNNRMFGRLDEIGSFNLNKFNPLSLQICVFWKFMHCMSGFVWITTELDDTTLYHYEKIECIRPNCKYKNRDETDKDGCEEDLHVSHAIVKRSFWPLIPEGSTLDVTGSMVQFKMVQAIYIHMCTSQLYHFYFGEKNATHHSLPHAPSKIWEKLFSVARCFRSV